MKTKIANALFIFLLIICVILLSFPAYRKFFPPMTVVKDKINRQSLLLERMQKNIPAAVMLQTKELLPEMIDSSVSGIGAIIDPSGLILTNWHLIADAETIRVKLSSGDVLSARVAVFEPENDIALLQLKNPGFGLPVIAPVRIPDSVGFSIQTGTDFRWRRMAMQRNSDGLNWFLADGKPHLLPLMYQALDPDFSELTGGPSITTEGKLNGLNLAMKQNVPGFHFTMPLSRLENILARHLIPERFGNMEFGLIPMMRRDGEIIVARVIPGSPAYRAGIRRGMEITSIQGWAPRGDLLGFSRRLIHLKAGESVDFQLNTVGVATVKPIPFSHSPAPVPIFWKLGIQAVDLDPLDAERTQAPFKTGVVVTDVTQKYSAFRHGDVIVEWNKKPINNMNDLKQAVMNAPIGSHAFAVVYSVINDPGKGSFLLKRVQPVKIK